MFRKIFITVIFLALSVQLFGQISILLDDTHSGFETIGDWTYNENMSYYDGSAVFKARGDGSAKAIWRDRLLYPGTYTIEIFNIDYKFGKNTEWTVKTATGDSLVLCDMYYNSGWLELGEFDLADSIVVTLSDYFESDTGDFVYADAVRLTSTMPLYTLNLNVNLTGSNPNGDVRVELYHNAGSDTLATAISDYQHRCISFEQIPAGTYRIEAIAIGYETSVVNEIEITQDDLTTDINLEESNGPLYTISGMVEFQDENADTFCKTLLYTGETLVALDSVTHENSFELMGIPAGNYTLTYQAKNYAEESVNITVADENVTASPILLYKQFKFAWITDSHCGLSFTDPYMSRVISEIKSCPDDLDFLMHTGDLTEHGYNGELQDAKIQLEKSDLPYYISIGNHDTKWSESGLSRYQELFGDLYYSFDHGGFHFVCLNNAITLRGAGGYFNPAQYEWLKNDLAGMADPNMPVIVMYHIPSSADAVPNHWRITNILKDYRIAMIFTGHGHNNRVYDFDGLPGVMGMDTYNTGRSSGFNVVSVSEKEIKITPYYNDSGKGDAWHIKPCPDSAGTKLTFSNLEQGAAITEITTLQVQLSHNATMGNYVITPEYKAGNLSGSGKNWELTLDPSILDNGYHEVKVTMMIDGGDNVYKTFAFYTETGTYPKAVWRFDAKDEILSRPAYDEENVYFGTGGGIVYALNATSGETSWKKEDCDGAVYSSPAVENGVLYLGTNKGTLYALHTADGAEIWNYHSGHSMQSGITIADSLIYLGSGTSLLAVNKETGELAWSYKTNGAIESRPAVAGDKVICTSWDTHVYCLNRFTGGKIWSWGYQSSMYYAPGAGWPVIMNDLVFVVDPSKQMTCLSLGDGSEQWKSSNPQVWDSIGKNEKHTQVYIRSLDGKLYAFAPSSDRDLLWSAPAEFGFDAKPSMPFGKMGAVFAGGSSGNMVAVSQATGEIKWMYHTAHTLVNSVTPKDGVSAFMTCLDGTVAYITGDPALDIKTSKTPDFENLLLPAYPNPFNNMTTIQYTLKSAQKISIHIYDLLGKEIMSKSRIHNQPGHYHYTWQAVNDSEKNLASGLYIVKLEGQGFIDQKKILYLK